MYLVLIQVTDESRAKRMCQVVASTGIIEAVQHVESEITVAEAVDLLQSEEPPKAMTPKPKAPQAVEAKKGKTPAQGVPTPPK